MSSFRCNTLLFLVFISALIIARISAQDNNSNSANSTLACFFEDNFIECAARSVDGQLDDIQNQNSNGDKSSIVPISQVIAETRDVLGQGVEAVDSAIHSYIDGDDSNQKEDLEDSRDMSEARKKKLGKKKKKALQKILMVAMVLKAKLSLLLQLFSTHLQVKFFGIALLSLILNATRFWLDLKKGGNPSKVIYYEHAQHQHHYDHEDEHGGGYWGRSSDDVHDLPYSSHIHENNQDFSDS